MGLLIPVTHVVCVCVCTRVCACIHVLAHVFVYLLEDSGVAGLGRLQFLIQESP